MNISLKSASRGLTVVASLLCLGGVLSFVKSEDNMKPLALNIIIASGTLAVSSEFISRSNHNKANNQLADIVAKHEKEWKTLNTKYEEQSALLKQSQTLKDDLHQATEEINLKNQTIQILQGKVKQLVVDFELKTQELEDKLQCEDIRYQELIDVFKGLISEHLNERIYKFFNSLDESINKKLESEDYQAIHANLIPFKDKLQLHYDTHCELLKNISVIDGDLSDIVTDVLSIYSRIVDEQTALKTKFRNLLNLDERRSLEDAYTTLADMKTTHCPKDKAKDLLGEYNSFQKNQLNNLGEKLEDNVNSLEEMRGQVFDLIAQIESLALEKVALKDELNKLNQPQVWRLATGSNELTKGNIIIQYFWSKGIKLDRAFTTGDVYESKIYYHTDNNPRTLVFKELNEHSDALQQLCLTLKPITFDWDADKGLMVASLVWKAREKKDTAKSDIDAIWIPASKFETYVKRWERVRITAGSTGGKSPTAKNLALAIMRSRKGKGEIRLYDPQHGSKKDYWDMPKAGMSHEDNLQGMKELCQLIDDRRHGHNHQFVLYIFDEVDNTVTQLKEGAKFRDLIKVSLKEGSHADVGVIYIGQSADANEVPGMTHSNWNNAVQLHIVTNAGTAIEKLTTLTTEDKTKLLNQYRKIQEYCDRMNEELGLDIFTDSGAYRFALAVPLTGLPKFIQLPVFDSYDYSDVMGVDTQTQKAIVETPVNDIVCPHCGSRAVVKNGTNAKGEQYYSCKTCSEKPKRWIS
ncbi:hypothetical protein OGM63_13495 [Plectonema radiosum NIES-515]|uniref:Uncharacterized protein n=1 Tax=Plectonema radiosum NIES-515 TaxID=2986073 RepID=A0ABT3AZF9_9CYAN|nr:hypothetical protein [Plectonema radiosum]MCV3214514.1 hypothetical protein [Plectonema radiosum NIES-515]